jgi:TatD DNase family protein
MARPRKDETVWIDTHCHLDYFVEAEREAIVARARAAGVERLITIGTRFETSRALPALAERWEEVWCTVGIHPHHAAEAPLPEVEALVALTRHPKVVGIGESGLDYFYDRAPREVQIENFRRHIRAARTAGLPLVIHARDADEDVARILREEWAEGPFAFLLHCFSSGRRLAETALALDGTISFSGILTFPKSAELREIAQSLPLERLLVETDAPYLAPVPMRGKRNEPAFVVHTAHKLAEIKGIAPEVLAQAVRRNVAALFPKVGEGLAGEGEA